jgi:predicted nuclease with TOPRIM domain
MDASNGSVLAFITFVTGTASMCMLLVLIDEIFKKINEKLSTSNNEKLALRAELENLKSENDELLEKNLQLSLTIDELHTEILRIQPEDELVEENIRLVTMCGNLYKKCNVLKKELSANNSLIISNIHTNKSVDTVIKNKLYSESTTY